MARTLLTVLILVCLQLSPTFPQHIPHINAHLRRLEYKLSNLHDQASSTSNLHSSSTSAQVLRQQALVNKLRGRLWYQQHPHISQLELSDVRDMIYHQLHSGKSLTQQARRDLANDYVRVMKLLASRRREQVVNVPS